MLKKNKSLKIIDIQSNDFLKNFKIIFIIYNFFSKKDKLLNDEMISKIFSSLKENNSLNEISLSLFYLICILKIFLIFF